MGLLDQVIGGVLGQVLGGGREPERGGQGGAQGGGMLGGAMSPIVQALLMLLMSKGAGGLGDLLGGGHRGEARAPRGDDGGDLGGFGQDRGQDRGQGGYERDENRENPPPSGREGDFSDLSGMLDGPGDRGSAPEDRSAGAGPYAHFDDEAQDGRSGLDGLIDRFQRGGLGDVMESWIGHGENRPVAPNRLADALGSDTVNALQQRTGLNRDDLLAQLAQALPQVINGLTPQGRRPTGEDIRGW
ncbi:hypothetical protein ASF49_06685 [Methylobacterium sp. Leaf104]|uniref:YidB family protein n=1 Tax=Methylobacterium TaxID=407 RepID=UPI0006FC22C2|nr:MULTISPECIES: YidB family protein [Methylobacterium]KQP33574.1 hypothetical protein ASF49_06685 [Methylobacterium sp. Leaf104]MCI9879896.1 DUF937 domain-containing protein [Methylobacterium goesingense]